MEPIEFREGNENCEQGSTLGDRTLYRAPSQGVGVEGGVAYHGVDSVRYKRTSNPWP